jgi:hypothetical protein
MFNVFVRRLDVPGTSKAYRGDNGNIVVYEARAEAEAAAATAVHLLNFRFTADSLPRLLSISY